MNIYKFKEKNQNNKTLKIAAQKLNDALCFINDMYGKYNNYVNYENEFIDNELYCKVLDISEDYLKYPRLITNNEYEKFFKDEKSEIKIERKVIDHSESKNEKPEVENWDEDFDVLKVLKRNMKKWKE